MCNPCFCTLTSPLFVPPPFHFVESSTLLSSVLAAASRIGHKKTRWQRQNGPILQQLLLLLKGSPRHGKNSLLLSVLKGRFATVSDNRSEVPPRPPFTFLSCIYWGSGGGERIVFAFTALSLYHSTLIRDATYSLPHMEHLDRTNSPAIQFVHNHCANGACVRTHFFRI